MAAKLGRLGVWAAMDGMTAAAGAAFARRVEGWGYSALWLPESRGRNVLVQSAWLLAHTERLIVAPGIANIYARDAMAMANGQKAIGEQGSGTPGGNRFLLGLGVSHVPMVVGLRGHQYGKPVATMRAYLAAMKAAPYLAPAPEEAGLTVLAALGPRMLDLAAEAADGAHPYNTTPEHTADARKRLGPGKLLCPEQMVLLASDPAAARGAARAALGPYLALDNYRNNWKRMGFGENDLAGGGSDRLIDATIAWGDEQAIRARIAAHWDAGADHVCVQALDPQGGRGVSDERILALLAPGSGG